MEEIKYGYNGQKYELEEMNLVNYYEEYFMKEIELESNVFYEIRKNNEIIPYKLIESTEEELIKIRKYFNQYKESFFFLLNDNEIVWSILIIKNYIQSLAISKKYQRKYYAEKLLKFAINYILDMGYKKVELHILNNNIAAMKLYEKLGFKKEVT